VCSAKTDKIEVSTHAISVLIDAGFQRIIRNRLDIWNYAKENIKLESHRGFKILVPELNGEPLEVDCGTRPVDLLRSTTRRSS
jgi:hypothetical protein